MNWTSTMVPMWEGDLENFWRAGGRFQLRDVRTEEHKQFVAVFAENHGLKTTFTHGGTIAIFDPQAADEIDLAIFRPPPTIRP